MGTAEVESALVAHDAVSEGGCGFPHDIKGQGIYAYITLMAEGALEELKIELLTGSERNRARCHARPYSVGARVTEDSLRKKS